MRSACRPAPKTMVKPLAPDVMVWPVVHWPASMIESTTVPPFCSSTSLTPSPL